MLNTDDLSYNSLKNVLFISVLMSLICLLFFIIYLLLRKQRRNLNDDQEKSSSENSESNRQFNQKFNDKKGFGPNTLLKVVSGKEKFKKEKSYRFSEVCGELEQKKVTLVRTKTNDLTDSPNSSVIKIGSSLTDPVLAIVSSTISDAEVKQTVPEPIDKKKLDQTKPSGDKKEDVTTGDNKKVKEQKIDAYTKLKIDAKSIKPVDEQSLKLKRIKTDVKPDVKTGVKTDTKTDVKIDLKTELKTDVKKQSVKADIKEISVKTQPVKVQFKELPAKQPDHIAKISAKLKVAKPRIKSKLQATFSTLDTEGLSITSVVSAYKTDIKLESLKLLSKAYPFKEEKSIKRAKFKGNYFTVEVKNPNSKIMPVSKMGTKMLKEILPNSDAPSIDKKFEQLKFVDPSISSSLISVAKVQVMTDDPKLNSKVIGNKMVSTEKDETDENQPKIIPLIKKIKSGKLKVKTDPKIKSYVDEEDGVADSEFEKYSKQASSISDASLLSVFSRSNSNSKDRKILQKKDS